MSLFVVAQRSCWCDSPGCRITRASTWDQTELWHLQLICARFILVAQDGAKASMGHIFFTAPSFFLIVSFLLRLMWLSVKRCGLIHPVQMHLGSVRWVERELDPLFFFVHFDTSSIKFQLNSVFHHLSLQWSQDVLCSPFSSFCSWAQAERLFGDVSESFHDVVIGWVTGVQWELWF